MEHLLPIFIFAIYFVPVVILVGIIYNSWRDSQKSHEEFRRYLNHKLPPMSAEPKEEIKKLKKDLIEKKLIEVYWAGRHKEEADRIRKKRSGKL